MAFLGPETSVTVTAVCKYLQSDIFGQVALGACTRNCASGDVLDFVVDDLDQQPMPQLS